MSQQRFDYDDEILSSCAQSRLSAMVAKEMLKHEIEDVEFRTFLAETATANKTSNNNNNGDDDDACFLLHQQHAKHYHRLLPDETNKIQSKEEEILGHEDKSGSDNDAAYYHYDYELKMNDRVTRFLQSVLHVHYHNSQAQHHRHVLHRVTLNQFADQDATPLFVSLLQQQQQHSSSAINSLPGEDLVVDMKKDVWNTMFDYHALDDEWILDTDLFEISPTTILLDASANLTIGHGGTHYLNHKHWKVKNKRVQDATSDNVRISRQQKDSYFAVPIVDDPKFDGALLKVKPRRKVEQDLEDPQIRGKDKFGKYLNWATKKNPDGVAIVKDAFDQGECGSCWAFAAAGSLEASVSRRQAHDAYTEYLERATLRREKRSIREIHQEAVQFAKNVEQAAFRMSNLSIQELIDCDTAADQGCVGGNPLLAFYFIHHYGLTSWSHYPYAGYKDTCHKNLVNRPVAKVRAWGVIAPNFENHIELVLRHVGPVAVGINGAERSFLGYQDGIFDRPNCQQGANHALLIVGYGEEETDYGEVVKYWIARNSWGLGWGINGYVKIRRGDGLKGTPGVCGLARSPSVALGGLMLQDRHRLQPYHDPRPTPPGSQPLSREESGSVCFRLGIDSCSSFLESFENHKALVLGLTGIFFATLLVVWPLTYQCRRRRQWRRARRQRLEQENIICENAVNGSANGEDPSPPTEVDPLLGQSKATVYAS